MGRGPVPAVARGQDRAAVAADHVERRLPDGELVREPEQQHEADRADRKPGDRDARRRSRSRMEQDRISTPADQRRRPWQMPLRHIAASDRGSDMKPVAAAREHPAHDQQPASSEQ